MKTDCIDGYVFNYHTLAPMVALTEHIYIISC